MSNTAAKAPTESSHLSPGENEINIANHKSAAEHLKKASEHHLDAARHHEKENHEKAAESTIKANGHSDMAYERQKEDAKHHAGSNEGKK